MSESLHRDKVAKWIRQYPEAFVEALPNYMLDQLIGLLVTERAIRRARDRESSPPKIATGDILGHSDPITSKNFFGGSE